MKNKKAILMPETLKIILAVISIGILFYLSVSLYGIFSKKTNLEKAEAILEEIGDKINSLEQEQTNTILITGPIGWRIVAFEKELCICKPADNRDKQRKICSIEGACITSSINFFLDNSCTSGGTSLSDCIDLNKEKIPFILHIARLYDRYYLGLTFYDPPKWDITEGFYRPSLESIADEEFNNLVKFYLEDSSDKNKENLRLKIDSSKIIKDASSENLFWKLKIRFLSSEFPEEIIYDSNILSYCEYESLCEDKDHTSFKNVETSKGFANLDFYLCECNK